MRQPPLVGKLAPGINSPGSNRSIAALFAGIRMRTCDLGDQLPLRAITIIRRVDGVYGSESNPPYTRT